MKHGSQKTSGSLKGKERIEGIQGVGEVEEGESTYDYQEILTYKGDKQTRPQSRFTHRRLGYRLFISAILSIRTGHAIPNEAMSSENVGYGSVHNQAFRSFFGEEHQTFKLKMFHNLDQLRLQLERENLHGQDFEDFTRCEPSAYRRDLLENMDTLEAVIHRAVNTYGILRMKENDVNASKVNGSRLHDEILHEHQINSLIEPSKSEIETQMQRQEEKVDMREAVDAGLVVTESSGTKPDKQGYNISEHLYLTLMEIPCSNKIKFITACSFSNDSFEDIMKAQVSVIKASATLNIQAFKIKKSVSISFRMTQVHKMAKDHMMMIKDYDWMMISKKLKDHIQVKIKPKSLKFTASDSQDTDQ
ncbi:hypothetical protein Tco_1345535 [Tanacetum coccineum]